MRDTKSVMMIEEDDGWNELKGNMKLKKGGKWKDNRQ